MARRILWFLPTLLAVTVIAFAGISAAFGAAQKQLPLFLNLHPEDVDTKSWALARQLAEGESSRARDELNRLGAAALPTLLPRLDQLSPRSRRRVALALAPMAKRMELELPSDLGEENALRYWRSFWDQHAVDFESVAIRRLVTRFVERSSPQREHELYQLDTAALPELMTQLDARSTSYAAIAAISRVLTHITGTSPQATTMDEDGAARTVAFWQMWWGAHGSNYTNPQGFERLLAPLLNTQYAHWARDAARTRFGTTRSGEPALSAFARVVPTSLMLFLFATLFGPLVAALLLVVESALAERTRLHLPGVAGLGFAMATLALWSLSRGAAATAQSPLLRIAIAQLVVLTVATALSLREQRVQLAILSRSPFVSTYRLLGIGRTGLTWIRLRHARAFIVSAATRSAATSLSAVMVVEATLGIDGLGFRSVLALHHRDTNWLMLATLATTTLMGVLFLAADAFKRATGLSRLEEQDDW